MWVSVGYDREKNLHWAERGKLSLQLKMDMALSLVHCRGSRALSRSLCYGFQFQSLEEVAPGHGRTRCVPLTSVWPIRYSAAVKTRGPLLSWPSCPELSGCQGAFPETQLISFPILATYVVGHRCQGRVEFSGCISASSSPVRWRLGVTSE